MADSQQVQNSNSGSTSEEVTDFHRRLPYDPAALKRRKLYNPGKLKSGDFFGKMGIALGHQGAHKPDSKHSEGDTQKYNSSSEGRSHGARGNNGAGIQDNAPASLGAKSEYPSQSIRRGRGGLGPANNRYSLLASDQFDKRSHGARGNGGSGVRTTPGGNQRYGQE